MLVNYFGVRVIIFSVTSVSVPLSSHLFVLARMPLHGTRWQMTSYTYLLVVWQLRSWREAGAPLVLMFKKPTHHPILSQFLNILYMYFVFSVYIYLYILIVISCRGGKLWLRSGVFRSKGNGFATGDICLIFVW